jgi:hypothetical protein
MIYIENATNFRAQTLVIDFSYNFNHYYIYKSLNLQRNPRYIVQEYWTIS